MSESGLVLLLAAVSILDTLGKYVTVAILIVLVAVLLQAFKAFLLSLWVSTAFVISSCQSGITLELFAVASFWLVSAGGGNDDDNKEDGGKLHVGGYCMQQKYFFCFMEQLMLQNYTAFRKK